MKRKIKIFNKINGLGYAPMAKISPYSKISNKRLRKVKFSFRKTDEYVKKFSTKVNTWLDVGTANGEFIHYLSKEWKKTNFIGLDVTKDFIEVAKKINKNSRNVKFHCLDIFKANQKKYISDVVTCLGTLAIFPDPRKFLNKLLNLVNKKGTLIVDGRINYYDISAQIKYMDDSKKISSNLWRCDYNLHSEKMIRKILSKRSDIKKIYFKYPSIDTKIPRVKNAPHINNWTIDLKKGYEITNGLRILHNTGYLIVVKK